MNTNHQLNQNQRELDDRINNTAILGTKFHYPCSATSYLLQMMKFGIMNLKKVVEVTEDKIDGLK